MGTISWEGKRSFTINGERFSLVSIADESANKDGSHLVFKAPWMVRRYESLIRQLKPRHIFELGIYMGGSSVLFHRLAEPQKLVAVELSADPIASLDAYIEKIAEDSLKTYYGINQANEADLQRILQSEFGDQQLDLVVDDASHYLEETTSSFNQLFPRLRQGGVYVIEDWSWSHVELGQHPRFTEKAPLTQLILDIVMACPSRVGLIGKIEINRNTAFVWRGNGAIDEPGFDISGCIKGRIDTE